MQAFQAFLDDILIQGLNEGCYPSACAAMGRGHTLLAQSCVGRVPLPDGQPADENTLYDMASMSKILGPTMLALKAVEDGELSLDEPITNYFDQVPEEKKSITIFHLMTHTAGFVPDFWLDECAASPEDAARCILERPLEAGVGEKPMYSCMGYILLGKLLEKRFGKPLKDLARERVFLPLGMEHTCYCPTEGVFAATETDPKTGKPIIGVVHDENARFLQGNSGNAGVFMPLKDGIPIMGMLSMMGDGFLKRETMEKAIHNYTPGQEQHRGLGFQIAGSDKCFIGTEMPGNSFGHTGFTGTSCAIDPESGFWVLLLSNRVCPTRENVKLLPFRRKLHNEAWLLFSRERKDV